MAAGHAVTSVEQLDHLLIHIQIQRLESQPCLSHLRVQTMHLFCGELTGSQTLGNLQPGLCLERKKVKCGFQLVNVR